MPDLPATPELDKMQNVKHQSQPIGEFMEWLWSRHIVLAKYESDEEMRPRPISYSIEQLLADFFEIDLKKVEEKKRAVLEYLRNRSTSDGSS